MGVFGLLSHCLGHRDECVKYVDLVSVASEQNGIELLCDYYSLQQLLVQRFWRSLSQVSENPYLCLLGGEYSSLHDYVTKFVQDLKAVGISLVMFVDGSKGSSVEGTKQKMETGKSRHLRDLDKLYECLAVCNGQGRIEETNELEKVRPLLLEVQMFETLSLSGCEVVHCASGEADFVIARNLVNRPKAYAVLSNDSDFCIFKDSLFIPNELFDIDNDLRLGMNQVLPEKPAKLKVGIISSDKVIQLFEFGSHDEMVELSIVGGNDFTSQFFNRHLKQKIGLGGRIHILDIAGWVKQFKKVEQHPALGKELAGDKKFVAAIQHSRKFYNLDSSCDELADANFFTRSLVDAIEQGHIPAHIMGMHFGFYWHRMLLEDVDVRYHPLSEEVLAPLRGFIYRIVLEQRNNTVMEYGRTVRSDFEVVPVHARYDRWIPSCTNILKDKIFANLALFHRIMTHQEPNSQSYWYKRYGWRMGFVCYILRYFLVQNFQRNLRITLDEFLMLVALVFCRVDVRFYQGLHILPSTRCITIGSWFQNIYRHAYYFLGKLLHLSKEFPQPKNIFNGSVWTAFYMHSTQNISFLGPAKCQHISQDINHIIGEKRHLIRHIVEGIFPFNTQF